MAIAVLRLPRLKEGAESFSYNRMWVELLDGNEYVPIPPPSPPFSPKYVHYNVLIDQKDSEHCANLLATRAWHNTKAEVVI